MRSKTIRIYLQSFTSQLFIFSLILQVLAQNEGVFFFSDEDGYRYRLSFVNDGYFDSSSLDGLDSELKTSCSLTEGYDGIPQASSLTLCPISGSGDARAWLDRLSPHSLNQAMECITNLTNTFCVSYDGAHRGSNSNPIIIGVLAGLGAAVGLLAIVLIIGIRLRQCKKEKTEKEPSEVELGRPFLRKN